MGFIDSTAAFGYYCRSSGCFRSPQVFLTRSHGVNCKSRVLLLIETLGQGCLLSGAVWGRHTTDHSIAPSHGPSRDLLGGMPYSATLPAHSPPAILLCACVPRGA